MTRTVSDTIHALEISDDQFARRGAARSTTSPPSSPATRKGWGVVDADGTMLATDLDSRSVAIRMLGALSGGRLLPLFVVNKSGERTGDRLG
jgi:hypothetical protein